MIAGVLALVIAVKATGRLDRRAAAMPPPLPASPLFPPPSERADQGQTPAYPG